MRKILFFIIATLFVFSITSCETVVEIDLPDQESRIVVNGFISPDSLFAVHISRSVGALDNKPKTVINTANVKVYENDVFIEQLQLNQQGFFTSTTFKPKAGNTYKLEVSAPNYTSVTAITKMPVPVAINDFSFVDSAFTQSSQFDPTYKEVYAQINFSFTDNASETNYYSFDVVQEFPVFDTLENIIGSQFYPVQVMSNDPNIESSGTLNDELINGSTYSTALNIPSYVINDSLSSIYLLLHSISKEQYLYKKTHAKYNESNGNPFSEPVRVYTNVENGMGIFGAYSYSIKKIK